MINIPYRLLLVFALLSLLSVTGCAPLLDANVTGKVTVDGKPLTNGTVTFHPLTKQKGMEAASPIHADGTYSLKTENYDGVLSGDYVVTVQGSDAPVDEEGRPSGPSKIVSPMQYALREKSPLRFTIKNGPRVLPLALENTDSRSKMPGASEINR